MVRAGVKYNPTEILAVKRAVEIDVREAQNLANTVDAEFRRHEEKLFKDEGAHGGGRWKALTARYKARKDRYFSGVRTVNKFNSARGRALGGKAPRLASVNKILQFTGGLKRSLTVAGDAFHVNKIDGPLRRFRIVIGTRSPKGAWQYDQGRDAIQHTEAQKQKYLTIITEWFARRIPQALRTGR